MEIHSANGHPLSRLLQDGTNTCADRYGGPVENRVRPTLEVVDTVAGVLGADRVGVRLSPRGGFDGMSDSDLGAFSTTRRPNRGDAASPACTWSSRGRTGTATPTRPTRTPRTRRRGSSGASAAR